MSKRYFTFHFILFCLAIAVSTTAQERANPCIEFNDLNTKIRDRRISRSEGLLQLQALVPGIRKYYSQRSGTEYPQDKWVFPLAGYSAKAIGGKNGNGYIASGYDYFDGNRHGGHPAHDIFISDKDQDALDDKTHKPVEVLSVSGGVVVALETNWDTASDQRGGKYIWIYEPVTGSLFYYAHNNTVLVHIGDIVKPGSVIATVGRTGFNAHKKRSPTHLHLMQLRFDKTGYPRPVNCYTVLLKLK